MGQSNLRDVLHVIVDQTRFGSDTYGDTNGRLNAHAAIDAAGADWADAKFIEPAASQAPPVQGVTPGTIDYDALADAIVRKQTAAAEADTPVPVDRTAQGDDLTDEQLAGGTAA